MFNNAIVRKPGKSMVDGIGPGTLGPVNHENALKQHNDYVEALKKVGVQVTVLEPLEDFPDSCFVEDTAVLTKKFAILCNPGADSRNGEKYPMHETLKGFYKDKGTNIGKFGGKASNALNRITSPIYLETPVKSNFSPDTYMIQDDAEAAAKTLPEMELVYLDPPYNQHPYGSNYFMLNRISDYYKEKNNLSVVSGIPDDWNRSTYNKKSEAEQSFIKLLNSLKTKFMLVSYNSEGFIHIENMKSILSSYGSVEVYPIQYNTFRGSRNLKNRPLHVTEYLFLVKCYG